MTRAQHNRALDLAEQAGTTVSRLDWPLSPAHRIPTLLLLLLLLNFLLLPPADAQTASAQTEDLDAAQIDIDFAREQLELLESSVGRLDPQLLEPLLAYIEQLSADDQLQVALDVINQAMQITRVSEGLYDSAQFALLIRKIDILGKSREWREAEEWMEHLGWLLTRPENIVDEHLIDSFMSLSELHLSSVARNRTTMQSHHLREAARANQMAIRMAISLWGSNDLRIPPMLYRNAQQHYLQALAIAVGGKTALSLRKMPPTEFVRSRSDAKASHYFTGLRRLNEIRNIYLNQEQPDLEAIALSELYIGDWQVMFVNPRGAEVAYRNSFEGLVRAGIDREEINRFFEIPAMLPAQSLASEWQQFVSQENESSAVGDAEGNAVRFNYQEWSSNFPFGGVPVDADLMNRQTDPEEITALFSFNLMGLEEVARWYQGQYKKSVSAPHDLELLTTNSSYSFDREAVENMIGDFRFRPKLVDGISQTVSATLQYQFATE